MFTWSYAVAWSGRIGNNVVMVILLKTRIKLIACSETSLCRKQKSLWMNCKYKLQILEGMVYTKSSIKFFVYTNLQSFTNLKKQKKTTQRQKKSNRKANIFGLWRQKLIICSEISFTKNSYHMQIDWHISIWYKFLLKSISKQTLIPNFK